MDELWLLLCGVCIYIPFFIGSSNLWYALWGVYIHSMYGVYIYSHVTHLLVIDCRASSSVYTQ